jgi:hypothetical protein
LVYFTAIWYIWCPFGIFYVHLVHFTAIWYILWPFGIFLVIWYILASCRKKNLATLPSIGFKTESHFFENTDRAVAWMALSGFRVSLISKP